MNFLIYLSLVLSPIHSDIFDLKTDRFKDFTVTAEGLSKDLQLFPNPQEGIMTIESTMEIDYVFIFSATGEAIEEFFLFGKSKSFQLNLDSFNTGLYTLKIRTMDGQVIVERLTVE